MAHFIEIKSSFIVKHLHAALIQKDKAFFLLNDFVDLDLNSLISIIAVVLLTCKLNLLQKHNKINERGKYFKRYDFALLLNECVTVLEKD